MYTVELVNRQSLGESKEVEIINEPTLTEEINAAYTFEFDAHYTAKSDFSSDVLVKVEGQYFQIVRVVKNRQNSLSLSVQCEHVSYELIDAEDVTEEYEDTALGMLASILSGTHFTLGTCMGTSMQYYKPSTLEVRQRLIDVANLFGGELVFDNFTISLVPQRGSNKGVKVELGVNLLGVTEEIDYVEGTTAYELDLVDLAEVSGYELDFSFAEIGDTIQIIDPELGIHASERILSIQRNPFKPQLPLVTVGDYIRDLTEYFKEEKEEEKEEENKTLLAQFKVGKIDCLALKDNIDAKNAVLDYLKDTSLQGVIPSTDVELTENQTGVIASLKPDFSSYKLTAIITTETENGLDTDFYELPNPAISSLVLPQQNVSVSVTLVVTKVPFADLVSGKVSILEDGDNATFLEAYGVRFLINDDADGFLEDFKVGNVDVLSFDDIECTGEVVAYIKGQKPNPHALWEYETDKLKGIYASLKEQYINHHLTFIHTKVVAGKATTEVRKMPFANARIMEIPTAKDDSVIMVVTKEPFESLTVANVDASFIKAFGVRFKAAKEIFLEEFKIGETDYLLDEGIEVEKDELTSIITEIEYAEADEFTGLFLKLKNAYSDYEISIKEYKTSGSTVHPYTDAYKAKKFPDNLVALSVTVSEGAEKQIFAVKFKKSDAPEDNDYWLSEFRIGDVDCLALPGVQIESLEAENIVAEIGYTRLNEHSGVFVTLKEEYADSTVILRKFYTNGTHEDISQKYIDFRDLEYPNEWEELFCDKLALVITNETGTQFFGVEFTKKDLEPIEQKQVMYAYIGNERQLIRGINCYSLRFIADITNFRENFTDPSFRFPYYEELPETIEVYPVAHSLYSTGVDVWRGITVQVIDGVITSTLNYSAE